MRRSLCLLITLFLYQTSQAVVNVITPVPAQPNIKVPNAPEMSFKAETNPTTPKDMKMKKDYLETLFDDVEFAKEKPIPTSHIKLYDKLKKDSVAHGLLNTHPNMLVGPLVFRPLGTNASHAMEIAKGQQLLLEDAGTKSYTYKGLTDLISAQIANPRSRYSETDWVFMSNAFRTLEAPGETHTAHILGRLLSEYVLLELINKIEHKASITQNDRLLLSTLRYDLSQLYQSIYNNEEGLFERGAQGYLSLPIDPIYLRDDSTLSYPLEYTIPFDSVVGSLLDLLEDALSYDPYDDYAWSHLIDFIAFDLVNPWYYDQFSPLFWEKYFPFGFNHRHAKKLRHKWNEIRNHHDVKMNKDLRINKIGGDRALRRLAIKHSRPTSHLNKAIKRGIHRHKSTKDMLPSAHHHRRVFSERRHKETPTTRHHRERVTARHHKETTRFEPRGDYRKQTIPFPHRTDSTHQYQRNAPNRNASIAPLRTTPFHKPPQVREPLKGREGNAPRYSRESYKEQGRASTPRYSHESINDRGRSAPQYRHVDPQKSDTPQRKKKY